MHDSIQQLEQIINVASMTNKWQMWAEQTLPSQNVYVPAIFQMRDAFSHILKMFGAGIATQQLTDVTTSKYQEFFQSDSSRYQLKEVWGHCCRAFFDVADYIMLSLSNETNKHDNATSFMLLKEKFEVCNEQIICLRDAKSESVERNMANIEKWDAILQILTSAYALAGIDNKVNVTHQQLSRIIHMLESQFKAEDIQRHRSNFFEEKVKLLLPPDLPDEFKKFLEDDDFLSNVTLENPLEWQINIKNDFNQVYSQLNEYIKEYTELLNVMQASVPIKPIQRIRSGVFNFIFFIVSIIASGIITPILENKLFPATIPVNASNQFIASSFDTEFIFHICLVFGICSIAIFALLLLLNKILQYAYVRKTKSNMQVKE